MVVANDEIYFVNVENYHQSSNCHRKFRIKSQNKTIICLLIISIASSVIPFGSGQINQFVVPFGWGTFPFYGLGGAALGGLGALAGATKGFIGAGVAKKTALKLGLLKGGLGLGLLGLGGGLYGAASTQNFKLRMPLIKAGLQEYESNRVKTGLGGTTVSSHKEYRPPPGKILPKKREIKINPGNAPSWQDYIHQIKLQSDEEDIPKRTLQEQQQQLLTSDPKTQSSDQNFEQIEMPKIIFHPKIDPRFDDSVTPAHDLFAKSSSATTTSASHSTPLYQPTNGHQASPILEAIERAKSHSIRSTSSATSTPTSLLPQRPPSPATATNQKPQVPKEAASAGLLKYAKAGGLGLAGLGVAGVKAAALGAGLARNTGVGIAPYSALGGYKSAFGTGPGYNHLYGFGPGLLGFNGGQGNQMVNPYQINYQTHIHSLAGR